MIHKTVNFCTNVTYVLLATRLLFAGIGLLLMAFAALTFAGTPNGLAVNSPAWWTVVILLFIDGILFTLIAIMLGTRWRQAIIAPGFVWIGANLVLIAVDQFGMSDLLVASLLVAAGIALYRCRHIPHPTN
jgi:hypothetical protein